MHEKISWICLVMIHCEVVLLGMHCQIHFEVFEIFLRKTHSFQKVFLILELCMYYVNLHHVKFILPPVGMYIIMLINMLFNHNL